MIWDCHRVADGNGTLNAASYEAGLSVLIKQQKFSILTGVCSRTAAGNKQSLEVSYMHLSAALPILAVWTADVPKQMLDIYDRVVKEVALDMFAGYADIVPEMFVRVADLPIADSIRDLRRGQLQPAEHITGTPGRMT